MSSDVPTSKDAESWNRIDAAFKSALEHKEDQRIEWVKAQFSARPDVRDAVLELLADESPSEAMFDEAMIERDRIVETVVAESGQLGSQVGSMIGPYRLEQLIATGGMGAVYQAERADDQFQQTVAIKILPGWANDPQTIARLKGERQMLAGLQHPHITRLLDGGETGDGFPYLVTEFIDGQAITAYAQENLTELKQRLELFIKVAGAVHYAHQKLIIHRDIKPSNILVDKQGQPHLLDFGIAKLLEAGANDMSYAQTVTGFTPMTPEYASPEQHSGKEVTTASDVYQLGLLLFHMLTGIRASECITARGTGTTRPSSAVLSQQEPEGSSNNVDPSRLARRLKGDLDTIVLKALREDPQERYASAAEMAADLKRHLKGEAIEARPETLWSATRRLSSHYPFAAILTASLAVLLMVWATSMFFYARQLEDQRDEASRQAMRATGVKDVLVDIFRRSDPLQADTIGGKTASVWDSLDAATVETREQLSTEPEIQAELFATLAGLYHYSGEADKARDLQFEALSIYQSLGSRFEVQIAVTQAEYAAYLGLDNYVQAKPLMENSIRQADQFGEENPEAFVSILLDAGNLEKDVGQYDSALLYFRQAGDILKFTDNQDLSLQIDVLTGEADALVSQDKLALAEPLLALALKLGEQAFGQNHRRLTDTLTSLAALELRRENIDKTIAYNLRVIELMEHDSGTTYDSLLAAKNNLAIAYGGGERYHEEQRILREVINIRREISGPTGSVELAIHIKNLASSLHLTGDYDEALEALAEADKMIKVHFPPDSPFQALPHFTSALIYLDTNRPELAETESLATLDILEPVLGEDHFQVQVTRCVLAETYRQQGQIEKARTLAEPAMKGIMAAGTKTQIYIDRCRDTLAALAD